MEHLKYFSLRRFHSYGRTTKCACNPWSKTRLKKGIASWVAEQTFSWFRRHSRVLNDMRPAYYCFEHHDSSRQHPPSQQVKGAEGKEVIQTIRMNPKMSPKTMKVMKNMKAMKCGMQTKQTPLNVSSSVQWPFLWPSQMRSP